MFGAVDDTHYWFCLPTNYDSSQVLFLLHQLRSYLSTVVFAITNQHKEGSLLNLEALYNRYGSMVYNLALQYVQSIEDAEEITQDVFVAIHQSFGTFRQDSTVSTWIYQITVNKSLDFIKSKKRKKRFAFITDLFSDNQNNDFIAAIDFNHPGVQLEDKESLKQLFEHINSLPDKQKTALLLHKIEKLPQLEVARIMKMTPKAVESLVQRAKAGLAKKINTTEG